MMKLLSSHSIIDWSFSQKYSFSKWPNDRHKCDIQSIRKKYIVCQIEAPETCEDQIESL